MSTRVGTTGRRVAARALTDAVMLLHPEDARVLVLNGTAAAVWARCDGSLDVEGLIVRPGRGVRRAQRSVLRADVLAVLDRLTGEGFLASAAG